MVILHLSQSLLCKKWLYVLFPGSTDRNKILPKKITDITDLNPVLMVALSGIPVNKELSKQLLYNEITSRTTHERAAYIINVVNKIVLEGGQTYESVKDVLRTDELHLLPLVALYHAIWLVHLCYYDGNVLVQTWPQFHTKKQLSPLFVISPLTCSHLFII